MDFNEIEENLDMEFFLNVEKILYRRSRGVNGLQLNIKTCPACSDKRYKTYFGVETGRGNCFVCSRGFNKVSFIYEYKDRIWSDALKLCSDLLKDQGGRPKRRSLISIESNEVKLPNKSKIH